MRDSPSTLLVLCACLALAQGQLTNITITVFISGLSSNTTDIQDQDRVVFVRDLDGRQFQAAVDLAVEAVNNHSRILEGYNLQVEYVDSQCSAGPSVQGFIDQIFDPTVRLLIIGSDCSTATEPVAELAPFWGLVQISPLSSGPNLVAVDSPFTTFLRLVPSDAAAAMGVVSLMEQFNWTRLGLITQQESSFTSTASRLEELFEERNFTTYSHTFNTGDTPVSTFRNLLNSPARIIFLNVYPSYALEILCQAHQMGRTFSEGYLWLLYPWYPQEWWTTGQVYEITTSCRPADIQNALERAIIIDYLPLSDEGRDKETEAGLTRAQYERLLRERIDEVGADDSFFNLTHLYFDAVLMGALALDTTNTMYDISMFNYNTTDMVSTNITSTVLAAAMGQNFTGVSGSVDLGGNREIAPVISFRQYQTSGNQQLVSVFIGNDSYFQNADEVFPFPGTPTDEQYVFISEPLFIIYTILSCVGILFAFVVAFFLFVFRNRTVIKLSSPLLNMIIIGGTVLFYIDVILFGIDMGTTSFTTVTALCMIRLWVTTLSFSLLFGPIFLKTWRVYYAFFSRNRDKKRKVKIVPDWVLFIAMGVLLTADVVFMLFVTVFPDARLSLENQNVEVSGTSPDLPQIIGVCIAPHSTIWIIVLFVYKGLPLLIGLFLAFETRNTRIRQLNDSKIIGMSVYCVAILSFAAAIIGYLIPTPDVFYGVIGILIIVCNTTVLCLLLIPKFYALWKDPEGLRVLSSPQPQHSSEGFDTIAGLGDEVKKLKQELNRLSSPPAAEENISIDDQSRTIDNSFKIDDSNDEGNVQVLVDKKTVHFTPSVNN